MPREVLNSVGDDEESSDNSVRAPMSDDQTQFIEIIRLLTDLAQQYQTEDYRKFFI